MATGPRRLYSPQFYQLQAELYQFTPQRDMMQISTSGVLPDETPVKKL